MDTKFLIDSYQQLKSIRQNWENHWQECADYTLPRRADVTKRRSRGDKRFELVFDSTAIHAAELLASSLHGMLTNAASPWFHLRFKDEEINDNDEAKEWLESSSQAMYQAFARSNFQQEVHELYLDLVVFGTGSMLIEEDEEETIKFSTRHISEIYIQENTKGRVDTVYRYFKIPARLVVQQFGDASPRIAKIAEKNPYDEVDILHVVLPREDRNVTKLDKLNKPYGSYYVEPQDGTLLSEGGYDEFPYIVPRFTKSSTEQYGRSPAMVALADTKMLNKMSETIIKAAQKSIDPPLLVPDDGFILPVKTVPGGLNFYRSGSRDRIEPLQIGANIPLGLNYEEQRRDAIRKAFYVDQLLLAQNIQMTATEVLQRNEEKMRMLSPVLGRLQSEMLQPLIDRVFNLLLRKKQMPLAPEILQGQDIEIEYVSPLARAQRTGDVQSAVRALEILAPLNQIAPVLDYLDTDGFVKHVSQVLGVPAKILRSNEEVAEIRNQRAQAEAQAAQLAQAQQEANIAQAAAPMVKAINTK